MTVKGSRGPVVWPLVLTLIGVVWLLDNFLFLESFNVASLWPLLLVIAGAVILLRGDFLPDDSTRAFGITRGSVESALLEISAGEIDVRVRDLSREGRLIAGQFAANARPTMQVDDTYAHIRMDRSVTPWLTFADWELGLAQDLPWQLLISTSLGQVDLDMSKLIIDGGIIATGIGDIRVIVPEETLEPLQLRSTLGSIQVVTPIGYKTRITVAGSRMFGVHVDNRRYVQTERGYYVAQDADSDAPIVDIYITGTFGDAYLA